MAHIPVPVPTSRTRCRCCSFGINALKNFRSKVKVNKWCWRSETMDLVLLIPISVLFLGYHLPGRSLSTSSFGAKYSVYHFSVMQRWQDDFQPLNMNSLPSHQVLEKGRRSIYVQEFTYFVCMISTPILFPVRQNARADGICCASLQTSKRGIAIIKDVLDIKIRSASITK